MSPHRTYQPLEILLVEDNQTFADAVKAFLEGMGNQLSGLGFQTADDVFKRVEAGQMKPTQQAGTGAAPRYSVSNPAPYLSPL